MELDYIIHNAYLLKMTQQGVGFQADAAVGVKDGEIAVVGSSPSIRKEHQAEKYVSGRDRVVMPGLVDGHMHSQLALLRGLAQDMDNWMEEGVWPFSRHLDRDMHRAAISLNVMEAVKNGTTTFLDYNHDLKTTASIHEEFGTRALLAKTINEIVPHEKVAAGDLYPLSREKGEKDLEEAVKLIKSDSFPDRLDFCPGPQAPDMLSPSLLHKTYDIAKELDVPIHMHVAQGQREHQQMMKRHGIRSIPYLEREGMLGERLLAVHLTEASDDEVKTLARSGSGLIICSGSIAIIDGLVPPLGEFLRHSDRAALGSDQACGNNINNMFNEMKLTALLNKCKYEDPKIFPAWKVLRLATVDAAKALGLEDKAGTLEAGKKADLIMLDLKSPALSPLWEKPLRNLVPNLVYAASGEEVTDVMIDGDFVVRNGEFLPRDEDEIYSEVERQKNRLKNRLDPQEFKYISPLFSWQQEGRL